MSLKKEITIEYQQKEFLKTHIAVNQTKNNVLQFW